MKRRKPSWRGLTPLLSLPLIVGVVGATQFLEGGEPATLLQPTAALIVFGGTLAALLLSFPFSLLRRTVSEVRDAFVSPPDSERALIERLGDYATRAKKRGTFSLENEVLTVKDPFLARAMGMVIDGTAAADLRHVLRTFSDAREQSDEECAQVLEAAAGYAPTLGILGAVLGLIHVMENLGAPANMGSGIAVAFVATVYGVGSANLLFLPLATRLRGRAQIFALNRELIIEGAVSIRQGHHPRMVEEHLDGLAKAGGREPLTAAVARGR
jgi:chemotaxis protein MotA